MQREKHKTFTVNKPVAGLSSRINTAEETIRNTQKANSEDIKRQVVKHMKEARERKYEITHTQRLKRRRHREGRRNS